MPHLAAPRWLRRFRVQRVAAIVVLAVQATMAGAPLWEHHEASLPTTHIDESGKRHVAQHGEANCAACSVRAHTAIPDIAPVPMLRRADPRTGIAASFARRADAEGAHNLSRAPPSLTA